MLLTPTPEDNHAQWLLRGLYVKILGELLDESYYSQTIAEYLGIPQEVIKPILREMRLYGLVQYQSRGINEEGLAYGSGHFTTPTGRDYYHKMRDLYVNINPRPTES